MSDRVGEGERDGQKERIVGMEGKGRKGNKGGREQANG